LIVRSRNVTTQLSPELFPTHASMAAGGGPWGRSSLSAERARAIGNRLATENNMMEILVRFMID